MFSPVRFATVKVIRILLRITSFLITTVSNDYVHLPYISGLRLQYSDSLIGTFYKEFLRLENHGNIFEKRPQLHQICQIEAINILMTKYYSLNRCFS